MKYVLLFALGGAGLLAEAWALMVTVGIVHGEWLPMVPTLGYGSALLVMLAFSLLVAVVKFIAGALGGLADAEDGGGRG